MIKKLTNKFKKNNKGFTLVELLVVIAIIGVLAAVAVPSIFKSIDKSKVSAVETDYKAVKTAVLSFVNDKGTLPETAADLKVLAEYLDKVPGKTPFGGDYKLEKSGTKSDGLVLVLEGLKVRPESYEKLKKDLGEDVVDQETDGDVKIIIIDDTDEDTSDDTQG